MNHNTDAIRKLNDDFRTTFTGGTILLTPGFQALPGVVRSAALILLMEFNDFTEDNDPHGEHDFGAIEVGQERMFWKIDYYDLAKEYHSPNAADPAVTARVLTLMLVSEY